MEIKAKVSEMVDRVAIVDCNNDNKVRGLLIIESILYPNNNRVVGDVKWSRWWAGVKIVAY